MRLLSGLLKVIGAVIGLIVLGVGAVYLSDTTKFGRFAGALVNFENLNTNMEWWTPKDVVAGVDNPARIPTAAADARTIDRSALDAVVAWNEDKNPISLLVWHRGAIQLERYWGGFDETVISDTASMNKSITGLMVGYAIEDGAINSLDDPVSMYLPEWAGDERGNITVRNLLHMSSGLKVDPFTFNPFSRNADLFYGSNLAKTVLETERFEEPGARFQYSSINSQLLGLIVERATGKRLAELVSEKLWKPLGAADASLWLDREGGAAHAFCCFHTTPREWLRLGILLANGGALGDERIIPGDWLSLMTTPSPNNPQYGFQVWLGADFVGERTYNDLAALKIPHKEPFEASDVIFLDGSNGNRLIVIPSKELVIVRTGGFNLTYEESFIPNTLIRGIVTE